MINLKKNHKSILFYSLGIIFSLFIVANSLRTTTIEDIVYIRGPRIGAICNDGWRSYSTGSGTCSNHGGVDYWLYGPSRTITDYEVTEPNYFFALLGIASSVFLSFKLIKSVKELY